MNNQINVIIAGADMGGLFAFCALSSHGVTTGNGI